jgi:hypothetical protein
MNYVSSSTTAAHTVNKGPSTTMIISANPNPSAVGQTVPIVVTVTGAGATPVGTVTISSTGVVGTCTFTTVGGTGSCPLTYPATGSFTITATFGGDGNYTGSSTTANHNVN